MGEVTPSRESVCFGAFEVDLRSEELRRGGLPVRLPAQSFQVLRMLLSRPGELVTRQELQKALWPGESFGDFEHGLNAAVNRLREALGDSADSPRFIETLPRRGYRFISPLDPQPSPQPGLLPPPAKADIDLTKQAAAADGAPLPPSQVIAFGKLQSLRFRRMPVLLLLAVLVVIAVLFAAREWRYPTLRASGTDLNSDHNYEAVQVSPLTTLPGTEFGPTFSPDGSQVAFAWDGGNPDRTSPYNLYVKVVGSERVEQLTHHPAQWIIPA